MPKQSCLPNRINIGVKELPTYHIDLKYRLNGEGPVQDLRYKIPI